MKHLIVGYSNKANNNIYNILGVVGNIGLMAHVVLFLPYSNWVFHQRDILPDESSQFWHYYTMYWRWSTRTCDSFWSKSLKISIFWVNLGAFNPFTILKRPKMYCNISILMKHIDITINLLINWANFTKEANNWKVIFFTYFGKQRVNSACCTNLLQLQPHFSETRDSHG